MPEISGSSHSSKYTRGRAGSPAAAALITVETVFEIRGEPLAPFGAADERADHPDHLQDLADRALVEQHHRVAALAEIGGDGRLQIGEGENQVRFERVDSCRSAR